MTCLQMIDVYSAPADMKFPSYREHYIERLWRMWIIVLTIEHHGKRNNTPFLVGIIIFFPSEKLKTYCVHHSMGRWWAPFSFSFQPIESHLI